MRGVKSKMKWTVTLKIAVIITAIIMSMSMSMICAGCKGKSEYTPGEQAKLSQIKIVKEKMNYSVDNIERYADAVSLLISGAKSEEEFLSNMQPYEDIVTKEVIESFMYTTVDYDDDSGEVNTMSPEELESYKAWLSEQDFYTGDSSTTYDGEIDTTAYESSSVEDSNEGLTEPEGSKGMDGDEPSSEGSLEGNTDATAEGSEETMESYLEESGSESESFSSSEIDNNWRVIDNLDLLDDMTELYIEDRIIKLEGEAIGLGKEIRIYVVIDFESSEDGYLSGIRDEIISSGDSNSNIIVIGLNEDELVFDDTNGGFIRNYSGYTEDIKNNLDSAIQEDVLSGMYEEAILRMIDTIESIAHDSEIIIKPQGQNTRLPYIEGGISTGKIGGNILFSIVRASGSKNNGKLYTDLGINDETISGELSESEIADRIENEYEWDPEESYKIVSVEVYYKMMIMMRLTDYGEVYYRVGLDDNKMISSVDMYKPIY